MKAPTNRTLPGKAIYGLNAAIFSMTLSLSAMAGDSAGQLAVDLLQNGIEKGDTTFIKENVATDYIQHNPVAPDGQAGLLGFVEYLGSLDTPVEINPVRVLTDGDLVVVHSKYQLDGAKAVFDLFRVNDGKIVEHWDAIQDIPAETASGRTMTDGPTKIVDREKTAANKALVTNFVTDILVKGEGDKLPNYIGEMYHQHNPNVADGLEGLGNFIGYLTENNISFSYGKIHNIVAEGNFVFTQSEGDFGGNPTAFYDLFRVENNEIVEHWDVVQQIPTEFAHNNGMF